MSRESIRITNRRMIFLALLVWLGAQGLSFLEPLGVPTFLRNSLVAAGFIALPILLLWPWLKSWFLSSDRKELPAQWISKEARFQALVSVEIATLSVMLIFLLIQMPR